MVPRADSMAGVAKAFMEVASLTVAMAALTAVAADLTVEEEVVVEVDTAKPCLG